MKSANYSLMINQIIAKLHIQLFMIIIFYLLFRTIMKREKYKSALLNLIIRNID